MKQVKAQAVDTYVRPDATSLNLTSQRQQNVNSAFSKLGVTLENAASQTHQLDMAKARAASSEQAQLERDQKAEDAKRDALKRRDLSAKIKLAQSQLMDTQYQESDYKGLSRHESVSGIKETLSSLTNELDRESLTNDLNNMLTGVDQHHARNRQHHADLTSYGTIIADTLLENPAYTSSTINNLVTEHKELLGHEAAVEQMTNVAVRTAEVGVIDALLERDDLTPQQFASLQAKRTQIENAQSAQEKKDTTQLNMDLKLAREAQSRTERYSGLLNVISTHNDKMTPALKGNVFAEIKLLAQELETEGYVQSRLGLAPTHVIERETPEGMRMIPLADIKSMQNQAFSESLEAGDFASVLQLLRDPTDTPSAAKDYFGSFVSNVLSGSPEQPSEDIQKQYDATRRIEGLLGPTRMRGILSDSGYAEFQIIKGISDQEGLGTAIARFQDYKSKTQFGKPVLPDGWAQSRRNVVNNLVDGEWYENWFTSTEDARANVTTLLAPYFKVWGTLGMDEDQMTAQARRLISNSQWNDIPFGVVLGEAFGSIAPSSDNPYDETALEIFENTVRAFQNHFAEQHAGVELGDIRVEVLPHDPSKVVFKSDAGIPLFNAVQDLSELTRVARGLHKTRTEKLWEAKKSEQKVNTKVRTPLSL